MKRSEALIPLSHDHHQALYLAKRLRDCAQSGEEVDVTVEALKAFWVSEGRNHFRVEEEILLPASGLRGPSADSDVARMLDEHLAIRRVIARVESGEVELELLGELGTMLTAHIRFEERELFPRIEAGLDPAGLDALGAALTDA